MPRSEARIFTSIWRDEDFLALSPSAQRLYMFLLSQDDLAYTGVMPLRERRWTTKAAGLTVADIEGALKVLEGSPRRFIVTDEGTGELFVRSLLRRDGIWRQPNLLKLARESADQVESPIIRGALLDELRRLPLEETPSEQVKTLVAEFISFLNQGTAYPTAYPPDDPGPNPADDPTANPSADPTDKIHARAQGYGERNGSSETDPPFPLIPVPPSLPAQDRKRGTRLPDDFAVTAEMVAWFRTNCPHVDGRAETEQFTDYWHAKPGREGCKLDWIATWRNWMREAEKRAAPRIRGTPSVPESTGAARARSAVAAGEQVQDMIDRGELTL